jgi:hypothetical protein
VAQARSSRKELQPAAHTKHIPQQQAALQGSCKVTGPHTSQGQREERKRSRLEWDSDGEKEKGELVRERKVARIDDDQRAERGGREKEGRRASEGHHSSRLHRQPTQPSGASSGPGRSMSRGGGAGVTATEKPADAGASGSGGAATYCHQQPSTSTAHVNKEGTTTQIGNAHRITRLPPKS